MSDDLTYKLEIQAALNAGSTIEQLRFMEDRIDGLIQANKISIETWEEIDTVLAATAQRMRDYTTEVTPLISDTKLMAEWSKNRAAALKEEQAALAAKAAAEKEAAAVAKKAAEEEAAAAKEADAATKAAAATAKKAAQEKAAALKEQERLAKAAADAQRALDEQMGKAKVLASQTRFNSLQAGGALVADASGRIPQAAEFNKLSDITPAAVTRNAAIVNATKTLAAADAKHADAIKASTAAYKSEIAALQEEKGLVSGADMSAAQERLRQRIVLSNGALKQQVDQVNQLTGALNAQQKANGMGTSSRGGGGASFAALFLQQQTFQRMGKGLEAIGLGAVKTAAEYQSAFADVARTTDVSGKSAANGLEYIRQGLMKLDETVPMTFADLSKIATMGNEMGVQATSILSFTKTVAEYSAITGTSADTTANALGSLNEILHLNGNEYTNLGSAISYVGRMSVASEPEIVSMLQKMSSTATQMGMSKQQVVGLAGALASLKEPPERAQSALQNYTKVLDTALAKGANSSAVKKWANVMGMSPAEVEHQAQTNATGFMEKFLEVLHAQKSQVGKQAIFSDLGLNNSRVTEVMARLSSSIPLMKKLIDDANSSWAKGTDLQDQYARKTDTLAAHFQELKNKAQNMMADLGTGTASKGFDRIVTLLSNVVTGADDFVKRFPKIAGGIAVFASVAGAMLLVRSAMLAVTIAAKAFTFFDAESSMKVTGFGSALKVLAIQMGLVRAPAKRMESDLVEIAAAAELAKKGVGSLGTVGSASIKELIGTAGAAEAAAEELATLGTVGSNSIKGLIATAGAAEVAKDELTGLGIAGAGAVAGLEEGGAAAVVAGERISIGARIAGAGMAVAETLASFGMTALLLILGGLVTWLITDFPGAMKFAAGALGFFSDALIAIQGPVQFVDSLVLGLGAVVFKVAEGVVAAAGVMAQAFGDMASANTLYGMRDSLDATAGSMGNLTTNSSALSKQMDAGRKQMHDSATAMDAWATKLQKADKSAQATDPSLKELKKALADAEKNAANLGKTAGATGGDLGGMGDAADGAAAKVYTLADYSSDLSGVLSRAFDIKFGPTQAKDAIISTFDSMKTSARQATDAVKSTKDAIAKLRAEMAASQADLVKQQYFLGVANTFGDSLRATQIQATIGTDQAAIGSDKTQISTNQAQLAVDEDKATKSLTSNTAGAAANREALIGLAQKYKDYIDKLAASGANQATLTKKTKEAKEEFIKQATQLGFNKTAVSKVASAFDDMTRVIKGVPRNLTLSVSNSAALEALREFASKAASTAASAKKSLGGIGNIPNPITPVGPSAGDRQRALKIELSAYENMFLSQTDGGRRMSNAAMQNLNTIERLRSRLANGNYADGGYTGPGGKYEPAGIVHRGEYVVPAQYVNQSTGLPYADALGRLAAGIQPQNGGYANGGYVNPGMQVVELGPKSLAAVRDVARQEAVAVISAGAITGAVNSKNKMTRRRGGG